jgi:hypothetical protein
MSIEEAIEAYKSMSPKIFQKRWWVTKQSLKLAGAELKQCWFKGEDLKNSVQRLLEAKSFDPNLRFLESDDPSCRV